MTEEKLRELLNKELDAAVKSEVPQRVLNTPIAKKQKNKKKSTLINKKIYAAFGAIACVLVIVIAALLIIPHFSQETPQETNDYTCYVIDINPSVLVTVDKDNKVVSTSAINDDANLVLLDQDVKNAKDLNAFISGVMNAATKLGYIDATSTQNAVKISAKAKMDSLSQKCAEDASKIAQDYLNKAGVFGIVISKDINIEELKTKLNNTSLKEDSLFASLKELKQYTYEEGDISSKIDEYKNDIIKSSLLDIKEKVDFICEYELDAEKKLEVQEAKDYLQEKYSLNFMILTPQLLQTVLSFIDIENLDATTSEDLSLIISDINPFATTMFDNLFNDMPNSEKDYFDQMKLNIEKEYINRININASIFNEKRQEISGEAFAEYINNIIDTYGSVEAYYENILKK